MGNKIYLYVVIEMIAHLSQLIKEISWLFSISWLKLILYLKNHLELMKRNAKWNDKMQQKRDYVNYCWSHSRIYDKIITAFNQCIFYYSWCTLSKLDKKTRKAVVLGMLAVIQDTSGSQNAFQYRLDWSSPVCRYAFCAVIGISYCTLQQVCSDLDDEPWPQQQATSPCPVSFGQE